MNEYDPESIVRKYDQYDESSRLQSTADSTIMFEIERWFIEKHLPSSGTVIDVGGGPGRYAVEIAKMGRDVVITDITPKHIEQARALAEQSGVAEKMVEYRIMDVCDLSCFRDRQFSMSVCYGMLNYTLDRDVHVLSELARITEPNGPILVSVMGLFGAVRHVWSRGKLLDRSYREMEAKTIESGVNDSVRPHRKFYTADSLRETVQKAGLTVTEMAATPAIAASLGSAAEKARDDQESWSYVIQMEKKACLRPGLLDTGQHIIVAAKRNWRTAEPSLAVSVFPGAGKTKLKRDVRP